VYATDSTYTSLVISVHTEGYLIFIKLLNSFEVLFFSFSPLKYLYVYATDSTHTRLVISAVTGAARRHGGMSWGTTPRRTSIRMSARAEGQRSRTKSPMAAFLGQPDPLINVIDLFAHQTMKKTHESITTSSKFVFYG